MKILIIIFITVFIYSCTTVEECDNILSEVSLVGFSDDEMSELAIFEKKSSILSQIKNYKVLKFKDDTLNIFRLSFENQIFNKYDSILFVVKKRNYLISEVETVFILRHTMVTKINECNIKGYKINGIIKNRYRITIKPLD